MTMVGQVAVAVIALVEVVTPFAEEQEVWEAVMFTLSP